MTNSIHQFAKKGFEISTDAYERGRPEYPTEAIDFMINEFELDKSRMVADLGAGTGKFTNLINKSGAKIFAIEPVEGMRKKFSTILLDIEILNGTVEQIPLNDNNLNAVVVAQAFHWFNGEKALQEIYRVLKPHGKIGLIWNARDEQTDWVAKLTEIIDPYERGAPRYKSSEWKTAFNSTKYFTALRYFKFGYV